jgi:AcrR family transcriptional regulator
VALEAGVSKGLVLYYFQTRDGLITETWQLGLRRLSQRIFSLVGEVEGRDWWEAFLRASFQDRGDEGVPWTFWLEYWALASRTPSLRQYHSDTYKLVREHDAWIARRGIELGQIRPDLDTDLLADLFTTVLYGLAVKFVLDRRPSPANAPSRLAGLSCNSCRPSLSRPNRRNRWAGTGRI